MNARGTQGVGAQVTQKCDFKETFFLLNNVLLWTYVM